MFAQQQLIPRTKEGRIIPFNPHTGTPYSYMQEGAKHDASGTPVGPYAHGPGGLWGRPGQDPQVFSAVMQPLGGMYDRLPVLVGDDLYDNQDSFGGYNADLQTILTGVTASSQTLANQPTAECNPFPNGGLTKVCTIVNPFGRYGASLTELNIERVGLLTDLSDPTYLRLMNTPGAQPIGPTGTQMGQEMLLNEFYKRAFEAGHGFRIWVNSRLWQGDPANSTASNGWKDIMGFNLQINAGNKRDAYTNTICTAADSDIKQFGFSLVNGTGSPINRDIVQYMDAMFHYLQWNADQMGLSPVKWVIAMRPELFDEITKIWPVRYYQEALTAIAAFTNGRVTIAANETTTMRDNMRNSLFLPIRGQTVEVVLDNGITELNVTTASQLSAGQYASDIYFIPMTVRGGIPVTGFKPFNMANRIAESINALAPYVASWTTDGGAFRWYFRQLRNCYLWDFVTRFRLVMRTTQLAGRIQNVGYAPLQHTRDFSGSGSIYEADGGRTNFGDQPQLYNTWGGNTPSVIS